MGVTESLVNRGFSPPDPDQLAARAVESLRESLDVLARLDFGDVTAQTALLVHGAAIGSAARLEATALAAFPRVASSEVWSLDGFGSPTSWLVATHRLSYKLASKHVKEAATLARHLSPALQDARNGYITTDQARTLARRTTQTPECISALAADVRGFDDADVHDVGNADELDDCPTSDDAGPDDESGANQVLTIDPSDHSAAAFLTVAARQLGARDTDFLARNWANRADPDAADRAYVARLKDEHVTLVKTLDGFHLEGWLTEASGMPVDEALRALVGVPAAGDLRSGGQRRAQALTDMARVVLDHELFTPRGSAGAALSNKADVADDRAFEGSVGSDRGRDTVGAATTDIDRDKCRPEGRSTERTGSARPHLTIHANWADLARHAHSTAARSQEASTDSAGWSPAPVASSTGVEHRAGPAAIVPEFTWDDTRPIARKVFERIACDCIATRIVFGPDSAVLDVGRSQRTVTGQLRRAIEGRDRHCQYPGCQTPPSRGEIHHVRHWLHGGETSEKNSILLCWFHHGRVHSDDISISVDRNVDRSDSMTRRPQLWSFTRSDGTLIVTPQYG